MFQFRKLSSLLILFLLFEGGAFAQNGPSTGPSTDCDAAKRYDEKYGRVYDLRGSSNETFLNKDLTSNLNLDIKIKWETSANNGEYIINKMFRITKMY